MTQTNGTAITRRRLFGLGVEAIAAAMLAACRAERSHGEVRIEGDMEQKADKKTAEKGRLLARPAQVKQAAPTGLHPLGLDGKRDGLLYAPAGYQAERPAPLAVMLHGAGGNAQHGINMLRQFADEAGLIVLAPQSRRQTWDILVGGYGPDVAFIDRALEQTFSRYAVDKSRLAIGGFSDGASYALSLGLANGDLFTHVLAFSPGFVAPASQEGAPRLFITHGKNDRILPIERCSRKIVPMVRRAGYYVEYREFDGPHTVPADLAREAVEWFTA
jgi:predicted esterase